MTTQLTPDQLSDMRWNAIEVVVTEGGCDTYLGTEKYEAPNGTPKSTNSINPTGVAGDHCLYPESYVLHLISERDAARENALEEAAAFLDGLTLDERNNSHANAYRVIAGIFRSTKFKTKD